MCIEELYQAAMKLSDVERLNLATLLLASVPEPVDELPLDDDDFYEELQRRSQDWEGRVSAEDFWKNC